MKTTEAASMGYTPKVTVGLTLFKCPNCGSEAKLEKTPKSFFEGKIIEAQYVVRCTSCPTFAVADTDAAVLKKWNKEMRAKGGQ